jgi:hypothetical protein
MHYFHSMGHLHSDITIYLVVRHWTGEVSYEKVSIGGTQVLLVVFFKVIYTYDYFFDGFLHGIPTAHLGRCTCGSPIDVYR